MPGPISLNLLGLALAALVGCAAAPEPASSEFAERLTLTPCRIPKVTERGPVEGEEVEVKCGTFLVPENRGVRGGRMLPLRVVIVPSRSRQPREPVFFLSGGPGQAATEQAPGYASWWQPEHHDVVLMDIRGTGEGHALDCGLGGSDENPQAYLEGLLADGVGYAACRDELVRRADLAQYTTMVAMRDMDELRRALGYDKINLEGGSYGTRAAITYIRMFGEHVHAALLTSLMPLENRGPLYHAAAAQRAFDLLAEQCRSEAPCRAAYPDMAGDLRTVLARLRARPAPVRVPHHATGAPIEVRLTAPRFADALRVMLYSVEGGRSVPLLLKRARAGDLTPFAQAALQSSRGFVQGIRTGLMLSFTCAEDVSRIRPEEVAIETGGSFIGDQRVRSQMAACSVWPKGHVPDDYFRPLRSEVPVLLVSGNLDPVTPPSWGEIALRSFPNGLHVVLPDAHTPTNDCVVSLAQRLFLAGTAKGLDTRCVAALRNPPFVLPGAAAGP
jgi:pimeloyl-ACP methyl ester carboxylesterase